MSIFVKKTSAVLADRVKMVVYGAPGVGKTTLIATLPSPIILSAEAGLLSIAGADLPYIEIADIGSLEEAHAWLMGSKEAQQFESVALDSISEIAEICLADEMTKTKDGRKAYGEMGIKMNTMLRKFRDLPVHVYMSAKMERVQDESGRMLYGPMMPGGKLANQLPYLFDEIFAYRITTAADGTVTRWLQTQPDESWTAKDRSRGALDVGEWPNLGDIIEKIKGGMANA
jgi:phage nucleotide-binding protein